MLLSSEHKARWNEFVAGHPTGDFMQAWEWGELKARTGWEPLRVALQEDGEIIAGLQILKRPLPGGRSLFYAPRGPLVSLAAPERLGQLLTEVRALARAHRALALKIDPALPQPNEAFVRELKKWGARPAPVFSAFGGIQPRYVMKVNLEPDLEALMASFHPKWRYNIRLAERKGVSIRQGTREDIAAFYEVLQETARRDGFGVRARSYFYDLWDIVLSAGLGALFLGYLGEELLCGAIALALGKQCWYVYGASSNRHRNAMPNHLLQWEMMKWAKRRGCTIYDMRGVAPEKEGAAAGRLQGLNRFKRGFGAEYVEYIGEFDLVFSPLWYWAYNTAQRVRQWRHKRRRPGTDSAGLD